MRVELSSDLKSVSATRDFSLNLMYCTGLWLLNYRLRLPGGTGLRTTAARRHRTADYGASAAPDTELWRPGRPDTELWPLVRPDTELWPLRGTGY